jgi:hypothetical protein
MKKRYIVLIIVTFVIIVGIVTYKEEAVYDKYAKIEINDQYHNFGKISIRDTVNYSFQIKNVSNIPFLISKVLPGCTCTTTGYTKGIIKTGEIATVSAKFIPQSTKLGAVKSTVLVQCNAGKGVVRLELNGFVKI